jgi:hypothetical protein
MMSELYNLKNEEWYEQMMFQDGYNRQHQTSSSQSIQNPVHDLKQ